MKKILLLSAAVALFAACSNDREQLATDGGSEVLVPLRISASNIEVSTQVATRAANVSWASGDNIGVFGVKTGETPARSANTVFNGNKGKYSTTVTTPTYTTSPSTYIPVSFTAVTPVYLPANGDAIDVYAYYPWNDDQATSMEPTEVTANVNANQSTSTKYDKSEYYESDFMRAWNNRTAINTSTGAESYGDVTIKKSTPITVLNFKHKFSKLKFVISRGAGMTDDDIANISSVTIADWPTTATYNIYENQSASATQPLNITDDSPETITACNTLAASGGVATYEAIVYPNKMTSEGVALTNNPIRDHVVTITIGTSPSATYTFTIYDGVSDAGGAAPVVANFLSGMEYIFNVTINAAQLSVTAAITPWGDGGTFNGVIAQ